MGLQVASISFQAGETIPKRYTCDGEDISPQLSWSELPSGTKSLVLIVDDPDAPVGTWVHWLLFDIPAGTRSLEEAVPGIPAVEGVGVQGSNGWGSLGYGGPCPPRGPAHRYFFRLYALDSVLDLAPGTGTGDVEMAMHGHVLAQGEMVGRYGR
jgi:Raf kinase inhibitor-like YbhB/YbcL family protein